MSEVRVPSEFRAKLIRLADLSEAQITELCALLESHPEMLTSRQLAIEQAAKLKTFTTDEGFSVLEAVIPIMYFKVSRSDQKEDLVKEVVNALKGGTKDEKKLPGNAIAAFERNLGRLLTLSKVALKAKALSVATDSPRLFSSAKILSDMRPIFGEQVDAPLGMVILHNLKIDYGKGGMPKEFFVSLDSADLKALQDCVTRALDKEIALRKFAEHSNLRVFETSE